MHHRGHTRRHQTSSSNFISRPKLYPTYLSRECLTHLSQTIHLDKSIRLLDSPGIVFSSDNTDTDIILRNCISIDTLPDPLTPVSLILTRCNAAQLQQIYQIPDYANVHEFLLHVAIKKGKLKKGGVADLEGAAHAVLQDWNSGVIPFYTVPPVAEVHGPGAIVGHFSKEFDLQALMDEADEAAWQGVDVVSSRQYVEMVCMCACVCFLFVFGL